jgi:drug/metabolite transporter (DMT)-like permease
MIGSGSVLAWVMLTGFCIVVPWGSVVGIPNDLDRGSAAWLLIAGFGNILGLFLVYTALREGKVGIVGPIVSTEGAIAAVFAVLAGEDLAAGSAAMLVLIAVGIALAATTAGSDEVSEIATAVAQHRRCRSSHSSPRARSGRASTRRLVRVRSCRSPGRSRPPRILGVLFVFVPLAATSRLRLTRPSLPLVVAAGVAEVVGFALFAVGSRHGVAVAAVLASQFAAIAAVAAYFLFRERLTRVQVAGVATIVIGVAVLTALQADATSRGRAARRLERLARAEGVRDVGHRPVGCQKAERRRGLFRLGHLCHGARRPFAGPSFGRSVARSGRPTDRTRPLCRRLRIQRRPCSRERHSEPRPWRRAARLARSRRSRTPVPGPVGVRRIRAATGREGGYVTRSTPFMPSSAWESTVQRYGYVPFFSVTDIVVDWPDRWSSTCGPRSRSRARSSRCS